MHGKRERERVRERACTPWTENQKRRSSIPNGIWAQCTCRWCDGLRGPTIIPFLCLCVAERALFYSVVIFFFSLGKVYLLWVCLCVCIQACPALAFLVFQVEVKTTISYLSVQKFPLRFYIHVSPVYWANPGNYLGVVIRGEIEEGKRAIRRKSDVLLFARPVQKCIF